MIAWFNLAFRRLALPRAARIKVTTDRSSTTSTWFSRTRRVVSWSRMSLRTSLMSV